MLRVSWVCAMMWFLCVGCGGEQPPKTPPTGQDAGTEGETPAGPDVNAEPTAGDVVRGGQLYDKWWVVLETTAPTDDHPLWSSQSSNTRTGADTWRCKECHGWDYRGMNGAYASGSHMTGFAGILGQPATPDSLTSQNHDFSALGAPALRDLEAFMNQGLVDVSPFIESKDKSIIGADHDAGQALYDSTCASCHGGNGEGINFGSADDATYVGDVARDNPWEFMHKVQFGQPGTEMPASHQLGWTLEQVRDVVAHAQRLPMATMKVGEAPIVPWGQW